jgi:hypothetical protein
MVAVAAVLLVTQIRLMVLVDRLELQTEAEAVVVVVLMGHQVSTLDLLVVQEQSLFPTQVPSVAQVVL